MTAHRAVGPARPVASAMADSGVGIDPEEIDRASEPFFATKPVGKGTGLRLATACGIVGQAAGADEVVLTAGDLGRG